MHVSAIAVAQAAQAEAQKEYQEKIQKLYAEAAKEAREKVLDVLTDKQRKTLEEITGEEFQWKSNRVISVGKTKEGAK